MRGREKISQNTMSLKLSHAHGANRKIFDATRRMSPEIASIFNSFGGFFRNRPSMVVGMRSPVFFIQYHTKFISPAIHLGANLRNDPCSCSPLA